jgi:hypothetical protein
MRSCSYVVPEHESISRLADYRPKNVPRISQRLVNTPLGDFKGRDVAVARVQQNDAQNLLVEKLRRLDRLIPGCRAAQNGPVSAMADMLKAATTDSA